MSADMSQSLDEANLPLRVLVVDDEELARLRLKSLVGECGEPSAVVVGEAANAAQALVWLATRSCDLLLLDVQMPGRDGTQLAAELRLRSPAPAIVFVTAHAEHALKPSTSRPSIPTKPVKRDRLQRRCAASPSASARRRWASWPSRGEGRSSSSAIGADHPRAGRRRPLLKDELKYVTLSHRRAHPRARRFARRAEGRLGDRFSRPSQRAGARRAVRASSVARSPAERRRRPRRLGV